MRVSDRERDQAIDVLSRRCREGYLSVDTFVGRIEAVFAARTRDEVDATLADLPPHGLRAQVAAALERLTSTATDAQEPAPAPDPMTLVTVALPLDDRAALLIGRSRACDVVLGHPSVSRRHAELAHASDLWWVTDLGSTNGTWIRGHRVREAVVARGDILGLGQVPVQLA